MLKKIILLLLLFSPQLTLAEVRIAPYFARYEVLYNGFKLGELTQRLTPVIDGQQSLLSKAYTTGLAALLKQDTVTELSVWLKDKGVNLPVSYSYRYSGSDDDRVEQQEYDWLSGKVKSLRNGVETVLALDPGTVDTHMVQIALRQDLFEGRKEMSYPVISRSKLKQYTFQVLGDESVMTRAFGKLKCLKLKRGSTLFWLAEQFDYLPIKIEKDEDGTTVSSYLIEFKGD